MANPSPDKGNAEWTAARRAMFAAFGECVVKAMTPTEIADRLLAAATPPSPSTAPEVGERAAFEAWHRSKFATRHSTGQPTRDMYNGIYANQYGPVHQQQMWEAWQARAALASRPAEVDDEGLPPLPPSDPDLVKRFGPPTYTAEQYRQGQRDAVAADRARRAAAGGGQ